MIFFDFETKSYADLKKVGAWSYSEDPTTEVICACWVYDNDTNVNEWWPALGLTEELADLFALLREGEEIEGHNGGAFERSIWMNTCAKKYNWPVPADDQWRDSMASASYYALPQSLEGLARALGFEGKNKDGGHLITKYCKLHLKTAKSHIPDHEWVEWRDMTEKEKRENPDAKADGGYFNEDFRKFVRYCADDVLLERAVSNFLGDLPSAELEVFQMDQRINLRGMRMDLAGITCASDVVDQRSDELTKEFIGLTGFKPTQTAKVKQLLNDNGIDVENCQKDTLVSALDDYWWGDIPDVRRAVEIKTTIGKASTKKLDAMARQTGMDGRARFQTRYHGAGTGRWTGTGFQPLNLVRGYEDVHPEQLVRDIMHKRAALLDALYGDAMDAISKASRHWITADDGYKIIAGDFVSIEAVILACLAGEEWKVQAFRDGVKIYEHMADKIYDLPAGTVTKASHPHERQDGKIGELAFGYQGALGAWRNFDPSDRHTDERVVEICKAWRAEHPAIVAFWRGLETAALAAVLEGGVHQFRGIEYEVIDEWLSCRLLNGKRIWYFDPVIQDKRPPWHKPAENMECALKTCDCGYVPSLTYMAQKEGQWRRVNTYGGKLTENVVQATSREVLVPAMLRIEQRWAHLEKYPIILSVYDEIVCEVPEDFDCIDEFTSMMLECPGDWAESWPIGVDPWEGRRYKK